MVASFEKGHIDREIIRASIWQGKVETSSKIKLAFLISIFMWYVALLVADSHISPEWGDLQRINLHEVSFLERNSLNVISKEKSKAPAKSSFIWAWDKIISEARGKSFSVCPKWECWAVSTSSGFLRYKTICKKPLERIYRDLSMNFLG